jgi:hypothetical protein
VTGGVASGLNAGTGKEAVVDDDGASDVGVTTLDNKAGAEEEALGGDVAFDTGAGEGGSAGGPVVGAIGGCAELD